MNPNSRTATLLSVLVMLAPTCFAQTCDRQVAWDDLDNEVFGAGVAWLLDLSKSPGKLKVVVNPTTDEERPMSERNFGSALDNSTIASFNKRNKKPCSLQKLYCPRTITIDWSREAFRNSDDTREFWKAFHTRYPGYGILSVSMPGYSRNGNEALLNLGVLYDGLNGLWVTLRLRRSGLKWKVELLDHTAS